ncbi:hypothetical protein Pmar_PMAR019165 [Perkinsus marinus ATCC 50983]|uniref:Uncharacterized protein n=1 Tax=Perkinsus marinus (strain ATCC 50983 / TXsc) TaxID=423536 RepID=C5KU17_PERM5|nr:hypothetical protein Pmar_PMAR019165 [Perkinsus marinus ATCC 50983]EER12059.1 hypothetical protein Pmar_PMAR019165 [Perkinsus marinus ATCC 50983]|eukprot:XP_002780264.1 hypothetical protein Pmar_PMAR019165 [Perkinsus marinus ATCC 50983]
MPFVTSEGGITQVETVRLSEARRSTENLRAAVLEGVYTHYAEKAGIEDEEFDPDEYVEMIEKGPGPSLAERRLVRYAFLNGYDDALLAVEKGELSGRSDRVKEEVAAVYVDLHPRELSYGVPTACKFEPAGLLPVPQNLQLDDAPRCSIEKYDKVMSANQPPPCDAEDRSR